MAKNKKRIIIGILYLCLFIFGVFYLYYFIPLVDDELFNFGFAKGILDGSVPYLDFNMIIPPLFPYLLSLFLLVFGKRLLVYHVLLVVMALLITYFASSKIGFRSICLFLFILIYPYTGYNTFCLFLFMLLIYIRDKNYRYQDVIEAIIISGMFLTKHTLVLMIIPSVLYSRHKKKTIGIYVISLLSFLIYLIGFHSLGSFLDYCVLGMFRFTSANGKFTYLLLVELLILFIILIVAIKTKKREYYDLLCFQIMAFPIPNYIHFFICFVPIIYYLLLHFKKSFVGTIFFTGFSVAFFFIFSLSIYIVHYDYRYLDYYPSHTFMEGRRSYRAISSYVDGISQSLKQYEGDQVYVLGSFSYLVKLNLDLPLTKYDIINQGNMGYGGYQEYIREIDKDCKSNACVFVLNDNEALGKIDNQVDTRILRYVQDNYFKEYSSSTYSIYSNKK